MNNSYLVVRAMEFEASEFNHKDVISNMPDNVVTHILDRLPLQDAVRTGILSRNWRFNWTLLSQLVFDEKFFEYLLKTDRENDDGRIISRLLLHLKGGITKFVLSIDEHDFSRLGSEDIEHWILFLSRNGVKDLTLQKETGPPLLLPTYLFSCLELKHLKLLYCSFDPPASFRGLPNLLSLELDVLPSVAEEVGEFIAQSPLLEILNMLLQCPLHEILNIDISSKGKVKLVEIAKLTNLKMLSLSLSQLDNIKITSSSCIFELVDVLPKLQQLDLDFVMCKFTEGDAKKRSLTVFPCLKILKLRRIDLRNGIMMSCAIKLIRCFPNLQTLEITTFEYDAAPTPEICSPEDTMGLPQLRSVVFRDLTCSENELRLIKYLLACSPFLKKIVIRPLSFLESNEKLKFARKLLKLHRASPVVDFDLQ